MSPIFQYSGHFDDEHEYSDQEPRELDEDEGDVVVQEKESSIDGIPLNMMKQMKGDKWPAFSQGFMVVTTSLLFPTMVCGGGFFQQAN